ncbi:hypothetical protein SRABI80_03966 [Peribacillus frigoritolerans]|nr:hypothetical protein SRABI80_03966 [Peribacillus frigoritolerans]
MGNSVKLKLEVKHVHQLREHHREEEQCTSQQQTERVIWFRLYKVIIRGSVQELSYQEQELPYKTVAMILSLTQVITIVLRVVRKHTIQSFLDF